MKTFILAFFSISGFMVVVFIVGVIYQDWVVCVIALLFGGLSWWFVWADITRGDRVKLSKIEDTEHENA